MSPAVKNRWTEANAGYDLAGNQTALTAVKQAGATGTTYPISYGWNAAVVHSSGLVQDPGGVGQKVWTFDTNIADASVGLATSYNARVAYGTNRLGTSAATR